MNTLRLQSQLWSHIQQPELLGMGILPLGDFSPERSDYCEDLTPFKGDPTDI